MLYFRIIFCLIFFIGVRLFSEVNIPTFFDSEKEHVRPILYHLFSFESFSYTLLGDKPISFATISLHQDIEKSSVLLSYQRPLNILEGSWAEWQSKFSHFDFENYLFFEKKMETLTIFLINKKAFSQVFATNEKMFKDILGNKITERQLLERIQSNDFSLESALEFNEELLGIVLGYGRRNAHNFQERKNLLKNYIMLPAYKKNKVAALNYQLRGTYTVFHPLYVVHPVGFAADLNEKETLALLKNYNRTQEKASQLFKNFDLVEAIISQLTKKIENDF